jgi:hypothetical protein
LFKVIGFLFEVIIRDFDGLEFVVGDEKAKEFKGDGVDLVIQEDGVFLSVVVIL